jgi:hypothetical protein
MWSGVGRQRQIMWSQKCADCRPGQFRLQAVTDSAAQMGMHHQSEWGPRSEQEPRDEVHILGKNSEPFWPFLDGLLQNGCYWRGGTSCPVPKTASCLYASSKSGSKSSKLETRDGERLRKESTSSRSLATQYAHTSPTLSLWWPEHATVTQGISSRMAQIAHFFGMCSSLVLKADGA